LEYSTLKFERDGKIAIVTLNRPEKRNAISTPMIEDIFAALNAAQEDSSIRVVILTGAGKAFCSGMDLETLQAIAKQSHDENLADSRRMARMFQLIYGFPKPLITAVNGAAIAGGCGLATLSDFTIAAPEAKFGYTEVRIGFIPALVSVMLRRQVGEKHARDLLLTGRIIDAADAFRLGLVNEIVPLEDLMKRAREVAIMYLESSPVSLAMTKRLLMSHDNRMHEELELAMQENARIRGTEDFREGLASFLEKRKPRWCGH
jgi:methylglutaconyl-CoA hydratase